MKYLLFFACFFVFFQEFAFAGGAGSSGGNGGGGEVLFHAIAVRVSHWLEDSLKEVTLSTNLHLKEHHLTAENLFLLYQSAVKKTHVRFISQSQLEPHCRLQKDELACQLKKDSRICINVNTPDALIECNEDLFKAEAPEVQFAITFHEYMGIAGIEKNDDKNYSQYPVSKYLVSERRTNSEPKEAGVEERCFNENIAIIEEIFSVAHKKNTKDVSQDALSLRCFKGILRPNGDFEIVGISDWMSRHTEMSTVLEEKELENFCKHFGFKRAFLLERQSDGISIAPKSFVLLAEKFKNKSILWHHLGSVLYPVSKLKCSN